ncbi:unnamed protein product [marine sediment metagenome]|uniref:Uncharacterized protein n=1 Tax=marine sediment metagenome TaxID=412755 RepID=X0VAG6_9ZZZZ
MGYTTDFAGSFKIEPTMEPEDIEYLKNFSGTRRMKRKMGPEYGVEGEFFVEGKGTYGTNLDDTVVNQNQAPATQPGLWCQWIPTEDGQSIEWDGGEKFYNYVEWIEYLIDRILGPRGYVLNGEVEWQGEDGADYGKIVIRDNQVKVLSGKIIYEEEL